MDIHYLEARYKEKIIIPQEALEKLSKKVCIATTIQYLNSLTQIKERLEQAQKQTRLLNSQRGTHKGQLLGCMTQKNQLENDEDLLYIGDGLFHPKAILLNNNNKIVQYNPQNQEVRILTSEDISSIKKKLQGMYIKFLTAKNIGVLISLKNGQCKPQLVKELEKKYPEKNYYYLVDNTYDFSSLENFPFIELYINTMCERIGLDDSLEQQLPIINAQELIDFIEPVD